MPGMIPFTIDSTTETPKPNFFSQFGANIVDGLTQIGTAAVNAIGGNSQSESEYDYNSGYYSAPQTDNTKYYIIGGVLLIAISIGAYFLFRKKSNKK
jgi:LPXTG-motif cell wall-anchored protein